jgi:hyaluronoglucosaminidase
VEISPTPVSVEERPDGFPIIPVVGLVKGRGTDPAPVEETEEALRASVVRRILRASDSERAPRTPLTVYVGGPSENRASASALRALGVEGPEALPAEGYVLAAGRDGGKRAVVLAGKDRDGTYCAAQTLDQLPRQKGSRYRMPGVVVRDWPGMDPRGTIEGFYGPPWSQRDRLGQLEFYGTQDLRREQPLLAPGPDRISRPRPAHKRLLGHLRIGARG